ncbi:Hypothetical predicted protein [Paramuricea clavata]|uniref:Uncharacterized protein n=1 Tax=Paramuricea clavata TaxID=317549 RepID=A0A6S7FSP9_PARCT|nr:Hypothetical predicted protein [Paramuricea clavata]
MDFGFKIAVFLLLLLNLTMLKAKPYQESRKLYNTDRYIRTTCPTKLLSKCSSHTDCDKCNEGLRCIGKICHKDRGGSPLYRRRKLWNFTA